MQLINPCNKENLLIFQELIRLTKGIFYYRSMFEINLHVIMLTDETLHMHYLRVN